MGGISTDLLAYQIGVIINVDVSVFPEQTQLVVASDYVGGVVPSVLGDGYVVNTTTIDDNEKIIVWVIYSKRQVVKNVATHILMVSTDTVMATVMDVKITIGVIDQEVIIANAMDITPVERRLSRDVTNVSVTTAYVNVRLSHSYDNFATETCRTKKTDDFFI